MTEDDRISLDGQSDDQQNQPTLNTEDATAVADRTAASEESSDGQPAGSLSPGSVEEQVSESGAGETGTGKPKPTELPSASNSTVPGETLFFLTNRMNLNGILSSRLIAPRDSFQKYYTDLLQQTPGWVPLLRQAPTSAQIEAVTSERGAGPPVLVEFPPGILGQAMADAPVVYVPAVALSEAVAIHLRSERDLREHRTRVYGNVHPHDELLRVTPELFGSDSSAQSVISPPSAVPAVDWRGIDRIRGAINAAFASATTGEQLVLAAALIGVTKLPAAVGVPEWFGWLDLDDHSEPDARPQPDSARPDHVGFRAAYDVLGDRDVSEAWSPNEVLDAVESRVREADLADDSADAMVRNLGRVRSIVNVEADFEPFRPSTRALISAKALLLVLLRQELDQLLAWSDDETGADDATRIVAAVLAGRLRGLSRESTELRSLALDDVTAAWAVRVARGGSTSLGKAQLVANTRGTSVKIDGVEVASQSALLPDLAAKYQKTAEAKKEALRIKVSRAMGWPVEARVHVPVGALVESSEAIIRISTTAEVLVDVVVDEDGFIRRLKSLTGVERRRAAEAFASRR
ncbi:hypothetical protein [Rhodococcoides kroppenstedtii]|uniref:hypothetical protein n=1 Tax=Rhodococcoides kroppenstedtii TaxID=293050 RepID=UPI00362A04EF